MLPFAVAAQERCGTVQYMKSLQGERFQNDKITFEQWLEQKMRNQRRAGAQRQQAVYQIPVVVHVIHNGEAVGTGTNISDAQIQSQIAVLNEDFQRLNADASNTPTEFLPVAGSMNIEFVLAKQDPERVASSGIVRVQGPKTSYTINDNYALKALSYWPAEDYLNIWVCNMTGLLGYAQFPVSPLPGLENSSNNRLTDGLVIAYNVFGSDDYGSFNLLSKYRKGRTTTHEVGHFLGLRHIWGDDEGSCDGTDYVNDTPNQSDRSSGCPSHPQTSCGASTMFQNYLDYTDDVCMNIFTAGQVERMTTILENSPRRASLTVSHGLSEPLPASNDMGIRTIVTPRAGECANLITPVIEVKNYGINTVTSATIELYINNTLIESKNFNVSLSPQETTEVSFTPTPLQSGLHEVSFQITSTNGTADGADDNNTLGRNVLIPEFMSLPVTETFEIIPDSWQIVNPDLKTTWGLATAPTDDPSNTAVKMDFYNYEDNLGEIDALITPVFSLSDEPVALLLFDVAYARFQDDNDGLKIVVLTGCNADVNSGTVVYEKSGSTLQTRSPTTDEFVPVNNSQWRQELVDLSQFAGQDNLQLAFIGINDWGNNLYLDNISILSTALNDVALTQIVAPGPVLCANSVTPRLRIQNNGTMISSLTVRTNVNGRDAIVKEFSGLNFLGGTFIDIDLDPINLIDGDNTLFFEVVSPNGFPDVSPINNTITYYAYVNNSSDAIPLRETFEGDFDDAWTSINPRGGMEWQIRNFGSNRAMYVNGFGNSLLGDESWLVSPVLDFSGTTEAALTFDLSYGLRDNFTDRLLILVSKDCGITYSDTIYNASRQRLSRGNRSDTNWEPTESQWQRDVTIDLKDYAGTPEVRLAFVFVNGNGNNIYLDNIEFFVSGNPVYTDKPISVYPNPFDFRKQNIFYQLFVTFNLEQKGLTTIEVIDVTGKVLVSETPGDVLNQTYKLEMPDIPAGTYFVRASTSTGIFMERIIILK